MKSHDEMYVVADHCPECGVVPLHKGHSCGEDFLEELCPHCGKKTTALERSDPDDCPNCPFCRECCTELNSAEGFAFAIAEGGLPYEGTDETSIRYVKMMRANIKAANDPKHRTRLVHTLAEFIFADTLDPNSVWKSECVRERTQ